MKNIILKYSFKTDDNRIKDEISSLMSDDDIDRVFKRFKGRNIKLKYAYSNVGISIYDKNYILIGFDDVANRDLNHLSYEDKETFKQINKVVQEINNISTLEEIKSLTDYITTNVEDLLEIVKRKQYKIIPYSNEKEIKEYKDSCINNTSLITSEGYYKTGSGYLHFYDSNFNKAHKGNEQLYNYNKDTYTQNGICTICGKPYTDWGNNADPINYGRCCTLCSQLLVLPMRKYNLEFATTMVRRTRQNKENFTSIVEMYVKYGLR